MTTINNIILQQANHDEWEKIAIIEKSVASDTFYPLTNEGEIKEYIKNSTVFFIVLDNKEIGTISFNKKDDNLIYFDGLTVLHEHRRQGVATHAIKKVLEDLSETTINLLVHPENTPAILVYLKNGFVIKEWKENSFGNGEPRLFLTKE